MTPRLLAPNATPTFRMRNTLVRCWCSHWYAPVLATRTGLCCPACGRPAFVLAKAQPRNPERFKRAAGARGCERAFVSLPEPDYEV